MIVLPRLSLLIKSDTVEQVCETRIITNGIKIGMNFQKLQHLGLLFVTLLKPEKCLFVFTETQICIDHRRRRHEVLLLALF